MCCVISCFKTVPSLEDLEDMVLQNPHGNGFSIRTKENTIEFFKGMNLTPKKILEIIKNYGFNQGDLIEFVFHARITSHGSTCETKDCDFENPNQNHNCGCHGFVLDGTMKNPQRKTIRDDTVILYHNGTMNFEKLKSFAKKIIEIKEKHGEKTDGNVLTDLVSDTHALSFVVSNLGIDYLKSFAEKETSSKFCLHSLKNGIEKFNGFQEQNKNISCSNLYHTIKTNYEDSWSSWYGSRYTTKRFMREDKKQSKLFECPFENIDCVYHESYCMNQMEYDMQRYQEGTELRYLSEEFVKSLPSQDVETDLRVVKQKNKMNKNKEKKLLRKQKRLLKRTTSIKANNADGNRWRELKKRLRGVD